MKKKLTQNTISSIFILPTFSRACLLTLRKQLAGAKKVKKIKSDEFCYTLGMPDHRFLILTECVDLISYKKLDLPNFFWNGNCHS